MLNMHKQNGSMGMITSVPDLIKAARKGLSQKDFAPRLGVKQSTLSRYERGKANPPTRVIEQCMQLVHMGDSGGAPTADALAERIRLSLADPELGHVRNALARLVDAFVTESAQAR